MPTISKAMFQSLYDYAFPPSEPGKQWRDRAAKEATLRSNAVHDGQVARAAGNKAEHQRLNEVVRIHRKEMDYYNALAEQAIYAHHNPFASNLAQIDLHGLFVTEAERRARLHLQTCKRARLKQTIFITGRGAHSAGGVSTLKPAIAKLLKEKGVNHHDDPQNSGVLIAILVEDGLDLGPGLGAGIFDALSRVSTSALWVAQSILHASVAVASGIRDLSATPPSYPTERSIPHNSTSDAVTSASDEVDEWEIVAAPPARSKRRPPQRETAR